MHGETDTVTDPEVSRALYERASSKDKTIKLYPGMWHGLTSGEPDDNIEKVFEDIITWLDKHANNNATYETSQSIETCDIENLTPVVSSAKTLKETQRRKFYLCGLRGSLIQIVYKSKARLYNAML
ncbi:hypothetical protein TSUD_342160 [Trifolium subterraneum]|nr:hypothetical protein TSUD_342160 [Trifolium subterraneum]